MHKETGPRTRAPDSDAVEKALLRRARGYSYKEQDSCKCKTVEYSDDGKKLREIERLETVDVRKYMPPDLEAIVFWLKARRPARWGGTAGGAAVLIDNIPPAPILSADEMAADDAD